MSQSFIQQDFIFENSSSATIPKEKKKEKMLVVDLSQ
jgi:hypothetical protein